jgi:hypothetical protein
VSATERETESAVRKVTTRTAGKEKKRMINSPVTLNGDSRGPAIRSSLCHYRVSRPRRVWTSV